MKPNSGRVTARDNAAPIYWPSSRNHRCAEISHQVCPVVHNILGLNWDAVLSYAIFDCCLRKFLLSDSEENLTVFVRRGKIVFYLCQERLPNAARSFHVLASSGVCLEQSCRNYCICRQRCKRVTISLTSGIPSIAFLCFNVIKIIASAMRASLEYCVFFLINILRWRSCAAIPLLVVCLAV